MENVLISACLLGFACRYDGKSVEYDLKGIEENFNLIPFCPEIYGGLPTPRTPSEIIKEKVINKDGIDVTKEYMKGACEALKICKMFNIKKAVLKERSPSCGSGEIYDGTFTHTVIQGDGITAKLLKENGIEVFGESEISSIINSNIRNSLFEMQDLKYRDFHAKLMPNVKKDLIIGIRTPVLRKFAKELKEDDANRFLEVLPHKYYEENNLHAFLLENIKDYDLCIQKVNEFLPYVDNWATCDMLRPKCFKKHKRELLGEIKNWLNSDKVYTVRFAIGMLMTHFLDDDFDPVYPKIVSEIKSDEYYVNMMIAWYFATALSKQWEEVSPYITEFSLPLWVHNKAIQKAVESFRITGEQKAFLKNYKLCKSYKNNMNNL
ncbi:MAG: 2-thiouracil desulfurase family protein [Clostridia bacterium]